MHLKSTACGFQCRKFLRLSKFRILFDGCLQCAGTTAAVCKRLSSPSLVSAASAIGTKNVSLKCDPVAYSTSQEIKAVLRIAMLTFMDPRVERALLLTGLGAGTGLRCNPNRASFNLVCGSRVDLTGAPWFLPIIPLRKHAPWFLNVCTQLVQALVASWSSSSPSSTQRSSVGVVDPSSVSLVWMLLHSVLPVM